MLDSFQLIGTSIEDRYRVESVIGEGGFGIVYKGHHERLDAPIAIKCLKIPGHFTADARAVFLQRFKEEGKILVKLADAPGVPRVYDYGVVKHRGEDVPYLVLEWLDGQTLEDMLKARRIAKLRGMRGPEALAVLLPAVEALAMAHQAQIAHRDIKPANMFITRGARGPTIKVLDFGIAKAMQEGDVLTQANSKTSTNFRAFTPNYAAPEQFAPKRYGASGPYSDVYSLGLILVELLTDQPANRGDDFVECLEFATNEQRPSAQGRGATISNELEHVIAKAVALKPEQRYANATAFAQALRATPEASEMPALPTQPVVDQLPPTERASLPGATPSAPVSGGTEIVQKTAPGSAPIAAEPVPETERGPSQDATARPVSMTQPAGQAPKPATPQPPQPPQPVRTKRSPLPLVLGAVVVLGGAGGAAWYASSQGPTGKTTSTSSADPGPGPSAHKEKQATKVVWALDVSSGKELQPVMPLEESAIKGRAHYKLELSNDRIVRYTRIDPSGAVQFRVEVSYPKDGGWELKQIDGRGVQQNTVRMKDGVETHLARSGSPYVDGCARLAMKFDDKGRVIQRTCQSQQGHVIIDSIGCPSQLFELNDKNQTTIQRCAQEDGTPMVSALGVHMWRFVYDDKGNQTEVSMYGPNDVVVLSSNGCSRARYVFDSAGNIVEDYCIGPTGMPIAWPNTTASGQRREYDAHGCQTKEILIDADGRPVTVGSYAGRIFARDEFCAEVMVQSIDGKGKPLATSGDLARAERSFDDQGNMTEQRCFDVAHAALNCDGEKTKEGSVIRYSYDERGLVVSEKAFDDTGKPSNSSAGYPHESRRSYDERGQLAEVRYFGPDGSPATALKTVARRAYHYDALGAESGFENYGKDDLPVVDSTGTFQLKRLYDDKHRASAIELYDDKGQLAARTSIVVGGVSWPNNAAKLFVVRDGTSIKNKFIDKNGTELKTVDCAKPDVPCLR